LYISLFSSTPKANEALPPRRARLFFVGLTNYVCKEKKKRKQTTSRLTMIILVTIDCSSKLTLNCSINDLDNKNRKKNK